VEALQDAGDNAEKLSALGIEPAKGDFSNTSSAGTAIEETQA